MVDVPSFFTKVDFYQTLLPGYLVLTVYLLLFSPGVLLGANALSVDLLTVLIFLVTGPVAGLALKQAQEIAVRSLWNRGSKKRKEELLAFHRKLYYARIRASDSEKFEVDRLEAEYDFDISAGIGLTGLGAAHLLLQSKSLDLVSIILIVTGILLLVAVFSAYEEWGYTVWELIRKYPAPAPTTSVPSIAVEKEVGR